MIEENIFIEGENYQIGHTEEYLKVAIKTSKDLVNQIVKVRIEKILEEDILLGERID